MIKQLIGTMIFVSSCFNIPFAQNVTGDNNAVISGNSNAINTNIHNKKVLEHEYSASIAAKDLVEGNHNKIFLIDKSKTTPNKKTLLLLTATNYETEIIHKTAKKAGLSVTKHIINDQIVYRLGTLGGVDVVHMQPGMMGMLEPGCTPLMLMSVFRDLSPSYVIATGIAFGRQSKGHKLGDILVSRQLTNYESRKESNGDIYFRGDKVTSPMLIKINAGIHDWQGVSVHQGLVLSGNTLVNSKEFLSYLEKREPEYVGGDMETYGVYAVASMMHADWIMIKGISDWGDGSKNDDSHKIALQNVGDFIFHVIKSSNLA